VPVVSGVVGGEAREVIAEVAGRNGTRLAELGRDFDFDYEPPRDVARQHGYGRMTFVDRTGGKRVEGLELGLLGRHQAANAAVGMAALVELERGGLAIPEAAVRRGLAHVRWPVRIELVRKAPAVVLDSAHNVASVEALAAVLQESFVARRRVLIFATTRDKQAEGMLRALLPHFDEVLFTRYWANPRGVPPEELEGLAATFSTARRHVCSDPATAWRRALDLSGPDDLSCITGSLFLAAEMRPLVAAAS
jgi:dihydrofolate synthase/folylpolyglutamate synthase